MTSKKPAKKAVANKSKSTAKTANSATRAAAIKKTYSSQPSNDQRLAKHGQAKQEVLSGILTVQDKQTPPPTPAAREPSPVTQEISGEELYNRIQFNAYLLAEKDGFKADPVHYWVQAERAVKAEIRRPAGS
jgi:hypothetical protein